MTEMEKDFRSENMTGYFESKNINRARFNIGQKVGMTGVEDRLPASPGTSRRKKARQTKRNRKTDSGGSSPGTRGGLERSFEKGKPISQVFHFSGKIYALNTRGRY